MPIQTIRCGGCDRVRAHTRFSKTALRKYEQSTQQARRFNNSDAVLFPRCSDCSGAQTHELRCAQCDVVQGLDAFSKQQRRNPDNALCWNCSQDKQDLEPHHSDQVQEEITMDRIRVGATLTSIGTGSTAIGHSANSRAMGYSNGVANSTNIDGASDWISPQIPVPDDPRARPSGPNSVRSQMNVSNNTYASNASAISGTGWENFERTNAPYREQAAYRRGSSSTTSHGGSNTGFVKQGAVRKDHVTKAQNTLARQQARETQQAEQATLHDSNSDDDDDDSDAY